MTVFLHNNTGKLGMDWGQGNTHTHTHTYTHIHTHIHTHTHMHAQREAGPTTHHDAAVPYLATLLCFLSSSFS